MFGGGGGIWLKQSNASGSRYGSSGPPPQLAMLPLCCRCSARSCPAAVTYAGGEQWPLILRHEAALWGQTSNLRAWVVLASPFFFSAWAWQEAPATIRLMRACDVRNTSGAGLSFPDANAAEAFWPDNQSWFWATLFLDLKTGKHTLWSGQRARSLQCLLRSAVKGLHAAAKCLRDWVSAGPSTAMIDQQSQLQRHSS